MSSSSSSSSGRSVPEVYESTSGSPRIEVISSSSGGMSSEDTKTSTALKIMRSWYDVDSVITEELLGLIRDRYCIPISYGLLASSPS